MKAKGSLALALACFGAISVLAADTEVADTSSSGLALTTPYTRVLRASSSAWKPYLDPIASESDCSCECNGRPCDGEEHEPCVGVKKVSCRNKKDHTRLDVLCEGTALTHSMKNDTTGIFSCEGSVVVTTRTPSTPSAYNPGLADVMGGHPPKPTRVSTQCEGSYFAMWREEDDGKRGYSGQKCGGKVRLTLSGMSAEEGEGEQPMLPRPGPRSMSQHVEQHSSLEATSVDSTEAPTEEALTCNGHPWKYAFLPCFGHAEYTSHFSGGGCEACSERKCKGLSLPGFCHGLMLGTSALNCSKSGDAAATSKPDSVKIRSSVHCEGTIKVGRPIRAGAPLHLSCATHWFDAMQYDTSGGEDTGAAPEVDVEAMLMSEAARAGLTPIEAA